MDGTISVAHEDQLAAYACTANTSRGRLHAEAETITRSPYQRDRDRIIHSSPFRRLKHKTQVFVFHEGDYYRTRLTHSIEVAQIARSVARALNVNEDLAEALALAHDFGHTPFGHAGEDALADVMADYGGFDHNAQTIRIVTQLEERYAGFDGLNLTWEALEGLAKHNGPLVDTLINPSAPPNTVPFGIAEYLPQHDLELHTWPGLEAQIASLSDDIAYNNHDIDDGLRAGLFDIPDLAELPLVGEVITEVQTQHPMLERQRTIHEVVRRLINRMVRDLIEETSSRLEALAPNSPDAIRSAGRATASFSTQMQAIDRELKTFLMARMYRSAPVLGMAEQGKRVVSALFNLYIERPELLPIEWAAQVDGTETIGTARIVADFIAGMTDRFALRAYEKYFESTN